MLASNFAMLARYNAWANRALYDAAEKLGEAKCRERHPAAFFNAGSELAERVQPLGANGYVPESGHPG